MNEQAQASSETDEHPDYWPEGTGAAKALTMLLAPQLMLLGLALWVADSTGLTPFANSAFSLEAALLGAIVALVMIVLVFGSRVLMPRIWQVLEERAIRLFAEAPFTLSWLLVVLLSLVAGIFEEIVFRGVLQGWLETRLPIWAAIAAQAALFAALHPISKAYFVYVLLIGIALGWVYAVSGNLFVVIVAHVLYDIYALGRLKRLAVNRANRITPSA